MSSSLPKFKFHTYVSVISHACVISSLTDQSCALKISERRKYIQEVTWKNHSATIAILISDFDSLCCPGIIYLSF